MQGTTLISKTALAWHVHSKREDFKVLRDWSLITGRGGGPTKWKGGGVCEVLPLQKGGGTEKVLAMLKGEHKSFGVVFTR